MEDKLPRAFGMLSELPAFAVHPPCSGHCSRASLHLLTGSSYRLQNRYNRCPQLTEEKQRLGELKPKVPQLINGRMRIPAQHPGPALCLWSSDARIFLLLEISWFPFSQFSHSVVSDSLRPHGLQRARLLCPSPTLPELIQTHVHQVSDAIQPSHPLSSPSPPTFNLSQHQGLSQ